MKKHGILNSQIASVLANMGHTDQLCIADCGLPIPAESQKIDLALRLGSPSFLDVLQEIGADMKIEAIILAEEIQTYNPEMLQKISAYFKSSEQIPTVTFVPHAQLKQMTKSCKAVVRTGENTPYANIILQSGCIF